MPVAGCSVTRLPTVSIVIPVYNGANYLRAAIESALSQTYPHVEVIVVNDGSTDGGATRAVAAGFGDRIRCIDKANGGVATALNAGIEAMRGELFSWLSHDDLYQPWKVDRQVQTWLRFGSRCVVIGDFETMDETGCTLGVISAGGRNLVARPLDAVFCGLINGCTLLVPRDLFRESGLFEPGLPTTQDYHLWYRLARLVPFVHCAGAGVRQRIHPLQGSRQYSHLEEASRTFAHLIEATPLELMEAYEGSELRFLLRLRQRQGNVYPGLKAYLDRRIDAASRQLRYAVMWTEAPSDPTRAAETLASYQPPPAEVAATCTADPAEAGRCGLSTDIVAFLSPDRPPPPTQLMAALEAFVLADADVARPVSAAPLLAPIDGVIARSDVLPVLADCLAALPAGPAALAITTYPCAASPLLPDEAEVGEAFEGRSLLEYRRFLSESSLARVLAARLRPGHPRLLFLTHSIGGGIWTHLKRLTGAIGGEVECLLGFITPDGTVRLCRPGATADKGGGIAFRLPQQAADLSRILRAIGVTRVDVHSTHGFDTIAGALLDALQVPFDVTLLDYDLLARDPHLRLPHGRFAGDGPSQDRLTTLLRAEPSPTLTKAERIFAVSRDLFARCQALCPGFPVLYAPPWPEAKGRVRHVFRPLLREGEELRVVLVGTMVRHKGRDLILEAARLVSRRSLPIRFHFLGKAELDEAEREAAGAALVLHGTFGPDALPEALNAIAPHLGWIPSQVPETWSYVLSEFMEACLPVAASAIGALTERCHGRPSTWLLPWDAPAREWVELFLLLHATRLEAPPRWAEVDHLPTPSPTDLQEYLRPILAAPSADGDAIVPVAQAA